MNGLDNLVNAINGGNYPILFIGSGVSQIFTNCDWQGLINRINDEIQQWDLSEKEKKRLENLYVHNKHLEFAQQCRKHLKEQFYKILHQELYSNVSIFRHPTLDALIRLRRKAKTIWTTNYDRVIEEYFCEKAPQKYGIKNYFKWNEFRDYISYINDNRDLNIAIFKLHGDIHFKGSIILCYDDYKYLTSKESKRAVPSSLIQNFNNFDSSEFINFLSNQFSNNSFLFLGYSASDDYLLKILEKAARNQPFLARTHFIILPFSNKPENIAHRQRLRRLNFDIITYKLKHSTTKEEAFHSVLNAILERIDKPVEYDISDQLKYDIITSLRNKAAAQHSSLEPSLAVRSLKKAIELCFNEREKADILREMFWAYCDLYPYKKKEALEAYNEAINKHEDIALFPKVFIPKEIIGVGSLGVVFKVEEKITNRVYAIKVLREDRKMNSWIINQLSDQINFFETWQDNSGGNIHIVKIFNPSYWGNQGISKDGFLYTIMEYVSGGSLRQLMEERKASGYFHIQEALNIISQIYEGLLALPDEIKGHRDLKPENIIISPKFENVPVDFKNNSFIAVIVDINMMKFSKEYSGTSSESMSQFGKFTIYTPGYSPEDVFDDKKVTAQSIDVFSLGTIFHEMLFGTKQVSESTLMSEFKGRDELSWKEIADIQLTIRKATFGKREDRYESVEKLKERLKPILNRLKGKKEKEYEKKKEEKIRKISKLAFPITIFLIILRVVLYYAIIGINEKFIYYIIPIAILAFTTTLIVRSYSKRLMVHIEDALKNKEGTRNKFIDYQSIFYILPTLFGTYVYKHWMLCLGIGWLSLGITNLLYSKYLKQLKNNIFPKMKSYSVNRLNNSGRSAIFWSVVLAVGWGVYLIRGFEPMEHLLITIITFFMQVWVGRTLAFVESKDIAAGCYITSSAEFE